MRLAGKLAAITAAASGMGAAAARLFAGQGAEVAVIDLNKAGADAVAGEIAEAGGQAVAIQADLSDVDAARGAIRQAIDALGGLDILWNHAGHPGPARVEGIDLADYDIAMDLNIKQALVCTGEAVPAMRARGGGCILFTSSVAGLVGSQFSPVYSAAKFGVTGLAKALALRFAPDNIRVNAICPGPIDTPMLQIFMGRPDEQADVEANLANMRAFIPLGRTGKPEEVAAAALFLASDEASYITGVALAVDGGYTAK